MKTSTLLHSCLLTAGLMLGGTSAVQADNAYSIILRGGDFHYPVHDYHSCRHTSGWHAGHSHDRGNHYGHHEKYHGKPHKKHHGSHGREGGHRDGGRWQHGKLDNRQGGRERG